MSKKVSYDSNIFIEKVNEIIEKDFKNKAVNFANAIGKDAGTVSKWRKGQHLPEDLYIFKDINIEPDYMIGETKQKYLADNTKYIRGVPYYGMDVTASIVDSFNDIQEEPEFYVDFKPFNDCTAYFPVYGDSMYPRYCSGEIVAVKHIKNFDTLLWGEAYLIITDSFANNLRTIKLLFQHDDQSKIILKASNPNFNGNTVIDKQNVVNLFLIKGKITRSML